MAKKSDPQQIAIGLYLMSPAFDDAASFAKQLESALGSADVACVLIDIATSGAAKEIVQTLAPIAQARGAALLINGDTRMVARAGADGFHLRAASDKLQQAIEETIASLKPDYIIGVGGLRSRDDAMTAGEQDVDYLLFGEPSADGWVAPLAERVERISWWSEIFNVPCVAYAASLDEVAPLAMAGADFVALGAAVWSDPRGPDAAMRDAATALQGVVRYA